MKKRVVALFLAVLMCLPMLLLTGCNTKKAAAGDFIIPEEGFDTSKEITITFYHTMGVNLREVLDKYIPEFNKLYPNITIEHKQVGSYDDVRDQIKTEITVGNQPNIAYCYPDHVALYNLAKAVVPLDSLINSTVEVTRDDGTTEVLGLTDAQKNDFIQGYYDEGKQFGDGKMYTLPLSKSTEVLYYNKTFFDKHGLKVPTTWDEMEQVCEQIKAIDPDSIPLGYDSEANWFITMCEQQGSDYTSATGDHFLFDNEQNRAFVARFRDWYQKGYVTTKELSGAYTSDLFKMDPNEKGNSYMCIGSSAGASYQRPAKTGDKYLFDVDITTVPQVDPNKPKVISQGPSLCIFNKADPQEVIASWLFVEFLTTTPAFQADFSMTSGYVPVIKSAAEDAIYKSDFLELADGGDYIQALSVKVGLAQEAAYYTSPAFNGSSVARDQVGLLMQQCLSSKADGDVAKMIKKAFEDAIAECKYQAG
ncbi:MAG: extracellular solute-binding protein [Clostridia bacterium]|nr:extracellular solute-binding protein [Clostridia bacterium]